MLEDGKITDFKGTYQEYLSAKEKGKLSVEGGPGAQWASRCW